jgi:hypothetical protein
MTSMAPLLPRVVERLRTIFRGNRRSWLQPYAGDRQFDRRFKPFYGINSPAGLFLVAGGIYYSYGPPLC